MWSRIACFKILRQFTVIDWCVYDETNGQDGLYFGSQTIKVTDKDAPVLLNCAPAMFDVDGDCQRTSVTLTNMAEDNGDCASDWLKWQVFVDTWADGEVDYEYSSFLPTTAGVIPVDVYVWDEKGNVDFCTVTLTVIDNNGTGLRIAGSTATELGNGVANADVNVEAALPEYPRNQMTTTAGEFAFADNPTNVDYEITVNKNDNHTNGVSTLDLVLIQRHIIALADLDSPYKVIAADINRDDKVSSIDVVELRKVVLGVQDEFSNNTSWRFVDATQTFADATSPFPVDESREISNLSTEMNAENFVAVKIGDVNASATDNVAGATTEVRSGATMTLEVTDRAVVAGEQVEIAVNAADFTTISYNLAKAGKVTLTVMDVAGKVIRTFNSEGTVGMNTISIEKSELNTVGVLYYTLQSGDFNDTKKMIIIE